MAGCVANLVAGVAFHHAYQMFLGVLGSGSGRDDGGAECCIFVSLLTLPTKKIKGVG